MALEEYLHLYTQTEVKSYNARLHRNNHFYEWRDKILQASEGLTFDEPTHVYTYGGEEIPSVTRFIRKWEPQKDWDAIKRNSAKKNGVSFAEIDRAWSTNAIISTNSGTHAHAFGESCFYFYSGEFDKIYPEHQRQVEKEMLLPNFPKEEAICRFWNQMINTEGIIPMLAETRVHTVNIPQFVNYAGTLDLLMYYMNPKTGMEGVFIMDYKTNKSLTSDFNRSRNNMLLAPFNNMYDEDVSKYTLQLSAYQIPIADLGIPVLGRRLIHLRDDGTFLIVSVDDKTSLLKQELRTLDV